MKTKDEAFQSVVAFLKEQGNRQPKEITWSTRVDRDFHLAGDDGVEFMEDFFQAFEVDPTGIQYYKHFEEGVGPRWLGNLLYRLIYRKAPLPPPSHDLTVEDLVNSVLAGKWIDPV